MKDRMGRRVIIEADILRQKGLTVDVKDRTVSLEIPVLKRGTVHSAVILLGILKFRKSRLNMIGRDVVHYMVRLEAKKYSMRLVLGPGWPFNAPEVFMQNYNVTQISSWTADYKLYDIIKSFKTQHREQADFGKLQSVVGLDFIFLTKNF